MNYSRTMVTFFSTMVAINLVITTWRMGQWILTELSKSSLSSNFPAPYYIAYLWIDNFLGGAGTSQTPYSYTGADFPPQHPSMPLRPASLTLQESVRYGANGSDPVASLEWETLKRYPHGQGRTFLGPERREFLMAFYHQLHCVREIELGLVNLDDPEATPHHMKHCLDYLRQTILCSALDTLEKGDFMERNWDTQRSGDDMVCWDWELIYKELGDEWKEFTDWRDNVHAS